ncbi:MAG: hypothetical protein K8R46_05370 [Pirellulales bacterium]|nr:hypothetical protein [Pirellulales bacterium]
MRKMLLSILAVAVLLGFTNISVAQSEMKPVVTVSFSGYDKLMTNIDVFGRLGGNPDMGKGLEFVLQMMTQGRGLSGLDKTRPWGAVYLADDQGKSTIFGFLPVTELKQLVETGQAIQILRNVNQDNGVYEIQGGDTTLYARQKGNWAIIGQAKETLDKAPADPSKLLGDMPKNYALAVRVSVKNAPKEYREQILAQIRAGLEAGMMRMPDENEEQYKLRLDTAEQGFQQLATMVNELDDVMLGWNVDPSTSTTYVDLELTAQNGTKLVDQFAMMKPGKSKFAGFLMPQAALTANWIGTMTDADVTRAKSNLATLHKSLIANLEDQGLSKDEIKLATKLLDDINDFLVKTIETKESDGGFALLLDTEAATLVAGGAVAGGGKLEKVVEQLVADLKNTDPDAAKMIKLGADTHRGVRFHTLSMPMPEPELEPFVGDELEVILGVADDRVYLAVGRDAAKTLKSVIDQSKAAEGKEVPPAQISLSVESFAKFIAAVSEDHQIETRASALASALANVGGKDHVLITAKPIDRGTRVRLELEEGLLKALATMGQQMAPMGGMPPGGGLPR